MYGVKDSNKVTHKEVPPKRVKRDEDDVRKLVNCFTSGILSNPFCEDAESLINFATGIVLPSDVADSLVNSTEKGREQMNILLKSVSTSLF